MAPNGTRHRGADRDKDPKGTPVCSATPPGLAKAWKKEAGLGDPHCLVDLSSNRAPFLLSERFLNRFTPGRGTNADGVFISNANHAFILFIIRPYNNSVHATAPPETDTVGRKIRLSTN